MRAASSAHERHRSRNLSAKHATARDGITFKGPHGHARNLSTMRQATQDRGRVESSVKRSTRLEPQSEPLLLPCLELPLSQILWHQTRLPLAV